VNRFQTKKRSLRLGPIVFWALSEENFRQCSISYSLLLAKEASFHQSELDIARRRYTAMFGLLMSIRNPGISYRRIDQRSNRVAKETADPMMPADTLESRH
jgi:hypothetical protein